MSDPPSPRSPALAGALSLALALLAPTLSQAAAPRDDGAQQARAERVGALDLSGSPRRAGLSIHESRISRLIDHPGHNLGSFAPARGHGATSAIYEVRDEIMRPLGAVLLSLGVAGLATGTTMMAMDPWHRDAIGPGVAVIGGVATVAGSVALALDVRVCERDPDCRDHEVALMAGATRVGVGLKF